MRFPLKPPTFPGRPLLVGLLAAALGGFSATSAWAQFHVRENGSTRAVPVQPPRQGTSVNAAARTPPPLTTSPSRAAATGHQWRYGRMDTRDPVVWARSIHHPNGNYTNSKLDEESHRLEQRTYTPGGQLIELRLVELDGLGRPQRVSIRDHRDRLKFTGVLLYDRHGRFREERLMDSSGQVVRTRFQQYGSQGEPLPVKTVIDENAISSDITLLVTEQSVQQGAGGAYSGGASQGGQEAADPSGAKKKKGGLLRRIFSFGRDD